MTTTFQRQLYTDLMNLAQTSSGSFLYKDYPVEGREATCFRVFTYNIPKHSEFYQPNALNCRGTMFFVEGENATLLALPLKKFFSLGETPDSQGLDPKTAVRAFLKEDGSLLTSYICPLDGSLKFKSMKMPTFMQYHLVEQSISPELKAELKTLTESGVSVCLELTTPENRVFIEYDTFAVHVLKARNLYNGEYVDIRSAEFAEQFPAIAGALVKEVDPKDINIQDKRIEGYVVEMENGELYKVKTLPYLTISSVINMQDRSKEREFIYAATLDEVLDEIRSLYNYRSHSPNFPLKEIMALIDEVEAYASDTYHALINTCEAFYQENKELDKASYARKAAQEQKEFMPVLMNLYLGPQVDYKAFAIKLYGRKKKAK